MDFEQVVRNRRMVRHFTDQPVEMEKVDRILDLARRAPSAGYTQGQSFIVVTNPETKRKLGEICGEEYYVGEGFHPFISGAPVLVVPCTSELAYLLRYREPDKMNDEEGELDWPVPYWFMDIGCSVMTLLLAAVNEGLAAAFAGPQDMPAFRALLSIPEEITPVGVISIGYPAPDKRSSSLKRGRKPLESIVPREMW
jgi:nitroreductase